MHSIKRILLFMLANYKILTVTHKRTNLKEIGNFVIKPEGSVAVSSRLEELMAQFQLDELLYLPTCNRVMYFFTTNQEVDERFIAHFFQSVNPHLPIETLNALEGFVHLYEGQAALEHLLEVAASIDSLVIGERQILRQLREAYEQCRDWGLSGDYIRLAVQQAVAAAKATYAQTRIGEKPVSIVSLAIQKMLHAHLHKDARILLVGAGQTNQLVAKFLEKQDFQNISVFNRSSDKAQQLAAMFKSGRAFPLSALASYEDGFDCLIVCTGATEAIITTELYAHLLQGDTGRKVVIDLSIPHNVAEAVTQAFPIHYIEIEGLRNLAKINLAFREEEVGRAQKLLYQYLAEFPGLLKQRQVELAFRNLPSDIKAVKQKAIEEVFRKEVELLDDNARELMLRMLTYMEKKCIGLPMKAAREAVLR